MSGHDPNDLTAQVRAMDDATRRRHALESIGSAHACEEPCLACACFSEIHRQRRERMGYGVESSQGRRPYRGAEAPRSSPPRVPPPAVIAPPRVLTPSNPRGSR